MALRGLLIVSVACLFALEAGVSVQAKDKEKESGKTVDSGTFSVLKNGHHVATERFSVQQGASGSTITAQLKTDGGADTASQASELRLSAAGDLIRYEWHEVSPGKAELVVTPNGQFLIERITTTPGDKAAEQPFLMPSSSMVLDNNSFVQREVLVWRYLASSCKQENGSVQCPQAPAQFGVIVPQDRTSMKVSLVPVGKEKLKINGTERELLRLNLKDDSGEWVLWLDDQDRFKLVRILVASDNTEVVRD